MIRTSLVQFMVLFVSLSSAQTVSFSFAAPEGAEMEKYPVMPGPLSVADQAKLGLAAKTLDRPADFFNHYRNVRNGRFVFETLPAGTIVLASTDGKPRYKADCGNRLVEPAKCPTCSAVKSGATTDTLGDKKSVSDGSSSPSAWNRFWNNLDKSWGSMWGGLGSLLGFLLPLLLLLGLLGLIAYAIARGIQNRRGNGGAATASAVVQNPASPAIIPTNATYRRRSVQETQNSPAPEPAQQATAVPPIPPPTPASNINERGEFVRTADAPAAPATSEAAQRSFRFTLGKNGNLYSKMNGYGNLRVIEDANGDITINADRI